ncbi:hypothetical protein ACFQER_02960 [Halomicroarcula sp. GCM10025894]
MLVVVSGIATPVAAQETDSTVVVATGDSTSALLTANAIADEHGYSVVRAPSSGVEASTVQTLKERDVDRAIVVGTQTDTVADGLEDLGLNVQEVDSTDTPSTSYIASIRYWDSSSTAFVVANNTTDHRKVGVALSDETVSAPVLSADLDDGDIEAVLDSLGVNTVYVSPNVDTSTRDALSSYTVQETVEGVNLSNSLQSVSGGFADGTSDVAVTTSDHVLDATQFGVQNATVLVAENESALGSPVRTSLTGTSNAYAFDVDESLITSETTANVSSIESHYDLRSSLYAAAYPYPVMVSDVESGEETSVTITNIGFASVPEVDGSTVTATWSGMIISSDPAGVQEGDEHTVTFNQSFAPGASTVVTLNAEQVDNGGHPTFDYYGTSPDGEGLLGLGSEVGFNPLGSGAPVWQVALVAGAIGIVVIGVIAWARNRSSSTTRSGTFRASSGILPVARSDLRIVAGLIALGMIVYPEPISSLSGGVALVTLLLSYAFNDE